MSVIWLGWLKKIWTDFSCQIHVQVDADFNILIGIEWKFFTAVILVVDEFTWGSKICKLPMTLYLNFLFL